jgi:hypothetical protein
LELLRQLFGLFLVWLNGLPFVTTLSVEAVLTYGVAVELSADGMMGYQIVMTH